MRTLIPTRSPPLQVANDLLKRLFTHPAPRPGAGRFDLFDRRVVISRQPTLLPQLMLTRMLNCDILVVFRLSQDRKHMVILVLIS